MYMLLWGLGASALVAGVGYRKGSLSESGFVGALLVGTLVMGFGGPLWFCMLLTFFISGSALSHYKRERKGEVEANFAKTGRGILARPWPMGGWAASWRSCPAPSSPRGRPLPCFWG